MTFLRSWLVDRVTILPFTGYGDEGGDTYGTARTVAARVERWQATIRSPDGEERDVDYRIAFDEADAPDLLDRVLLEGEAVADGADVGRKIVQIRRARRKGGRGGLAEVLL